MSGRKGGRVIIKERKEQAEGEKEEGKKVMFQVPLPFFLPECTSMGRGKQNSIKKVATAMHGKI